MSKRKINIISQMFDIKPVDEAGEVDIKKIKSNRRVIRLEPTTGVAVKRGDEKSKLFLRDVKKPEIADMEALRFRKSLEAEKQEFKPVDLCIPVAVDIQNELAKVSVNLKNKEEENKSLIRDRSSDDVCLNLVKEPLRENSHWRYLDEQNEFYQNYLDGETSTILPRPSAEKRKKINWRLGWPKFSFGFSPSGNILSYKTSAISFAIFSFFIFISLFAVNLFYKGLKIKEVALDGSQKALVNLVAAKENIVNRDFQKAYAEFQQAHDQFVIISQDINSLGSIIVESTRYLPYLSKLSSGSHLSEAGKNISQVGVKLSDTISILDQVKNPLENEGETISFLHIFQETDQNIKEVSRLLVDTEEHLAKVNVDDIPEGHREKFLELRTKLPEVNSYLSSYVADSKIFTDILGGNGPRKYLFLFQNNQEMRATGGFVGSYAIIDIFNGRVRNFFVDGIFNPDGQLQERIAPPAPIQKISVNWSLHDSNWFPNFPKSAEKAMWFYEKTGGPTVDGVITMTPEVLGRLLEITGPIDLPEYGVTVSKNNFIESIQYEVEVDYDKELNQPKKILGDLVPKILDKIFNAKDFSDIAKTMNVLVSSLNEKHILIYSKNYDIEKTLSERGWTGEILSTQKDYLSVINTNINGFKTDGVISENIEHTASIEDDGTIVNTVTIRREHHGGDTEYDWWNKVNADYMRIYVPKGSRLVEVSGQTREFNSSPIDYDALGYKRDPQIKMEEEAMTVDEESGTRIYEEDGKTVFANWVYVSPKETVEVKYTYVLPFKINLKDSSEPLEAYSLLAQKQSGSVGSKFSSKVIYPDQYKLIWQHPEGDSLKQTTDSSGKASIKLETDLKTDRFIGAAFQKKDGRIVIK